MPKDDKVNDIIIQKKPEEWPAWLTGKYWVCRYCGSCNGKVTKCYKCGWDK